MQWALSYIGTNVALIVVVALLVIALGAVAWFAKNWKVAVAAVLILAAGLAYQQIDKNAYERRVSEEAAEKVKTLQARIDTMNQINQANAERAIEDATKIAEMERIASETPANAGACLDRDAAGRVRSIK
jgi:apolipoprotein N-acyltransferase